MCVLGADPAPPAGLRKRLRLWELTPGLHCAVLGTCMSFADLVKTGRKAGIVPEPDATDYEVHAWFVQNCSEPGPLTRLLHKRLDRTWRTAIDAARAARDDLNRRLVDATRRLERHARENGALQDRLRSAETGATALASADARLREFESGDLYRSLRRGKSTLEVELAETRLSRGDRPLRSPASCSSSASGWS